MTICQIVSYANFRIYFERAFPISISLAFFTDSFVAHFIAFFSWNCGWLTFQERDQFNLQRIVIEQQNWQWIFPLNVNIFLYLTLSGLSIVSKMSYLWTDLSLLNKYLKLKAKRVQEGLNDYMHRSTWYETDQGHRRKFNRAEMINCSSLHSPFSPI